MIEGRTLSGTEVEFSVIVPTRGDAPHLRMALASALATGADPELLFDNPILTPAVVLARSRLRAGDRFDPDLPAAEDHFLWLRLARDRTLWIDPQPGVIVRRRQGSLSRDARRMAEGSLEGMRRFL